jgi:hydrogenase maturation protein HypF
MDLPLVSGAVDAAAEVFVLPRPVEPVLAVGAFLKNTVCLARGAEAFLSVDNGNLETAAAILAFEAAAGRLCAEVRPSVIAHDLHPDFPSTRYAEALAMSLGVAAVGVQHHHAHVAAVMAEHGLAEPVLGLALDGFGLGPDHEAWGGELLCVDPAGYRRLGHLAPLRQPGGDVAARQPWRMGAAALHALGRGDEIASRFADRPGAAVIARMLARGVNAPPTSSAGRLFDAACGLLGVKPVATFEGEAPMALEALVRRPTVDPGGWTLSDGVLDMRPLLERLTALDPEAGADLFHGTLAAALADWIAWAVATTGHRTVALCGGCFFNAVLSAELAVLLAGQGVRTIRGRRLDPGDRAISLGQAWAVGMARE